MACFRSGVVAALAAAGLLGSAPTGTASTFFGWQVAGVPPGDVLMVRAFPSNRSRVLVGYPNRTRLSLTGRCTGGLRLERVSAAQRERAVRRRWCEVWVDPTGSGEYRSGWVYGRFIRPL